MIDYVHFVLHPSSPRLHTDRLAYAQHCYIVFKCARQLVYTKRENKHKSVARSLTNNAIPFADQNAQICGHQNNLLALIGQVKRTPLGEGNATVLDFRYCGSIDCLQQALVNLDN
jgi:hypothetical protein